MGLILPPLSVAEQLRTICHATWQWGASAVANVLTSAGRTPRNRRRGRVISGPEPLDERIVPAQVTNWTNASPTHNGLWSDPNNWDNGVPNRGLIAVLQPVGGVSGTIVYDNAVPAPNQFVAGIKMQNGFNGTLSMAAGFPLTVDSDATDSTTGFKWSTTASISQATPGDVLIITGGGTAANNQWGAGTIGSTPVQGNIFIIGGTTLQITGSASTLGDNLIVGQDGAGSSVLEFNNQTSTLTMNNNAYIMVSDAVGSEASANQLLFDTDVTQPGTASNGLDHAANSGDSFIDNFGTITRSNAGTYQINVPVKNDAGQYYSGVLDVQSPLWVSGQSQNKTANFSVDQVGGETILDTTHTTPATLQVSATFFMNAGQLVTYGSSKNAQIMGSGAMTTAVSIYGGTLTISADDPAAYGGLLVTNGSMFFSAGTWVAYVNGSDQTKATTLNVNGSITFGPGAHLQVKTPDGSNPNSGLNWALLFYQSVTNAMFFDSGALYNNPVYGDTEMTVKSK